MEKRSIALFTIIRTDRNMLLACYSHKHISYRIRTIIRKAIICNIIGYVWGIGGPLMTVVIIGAALLAIFGRMPWPALFALGIFCAVFFGAKTIVIKVMGGIGGTGNTSLMDQCGTGDTKKNYFFLKQT